MVKYNSKKKEEKKDRLVLRILHVKARFFWLRVGGVPCLPGVPHLHVHRTLGFGIHHQKSEGWGRSCVIFQLPGSKQAPEQVGAFLHEIREGRNFEMASHVNHSSFMPFCKIWANLRWRRSMWIVVVAQVVTLNLHKVNWLNRWVQLTPPWYKYAFVCYRYKHFPGKR